MERETNESPESRPPRRNTGRGQPPQRRGTNQTRHFGANVRYVPPRNAVTARSGPYFQEPEEYDLASPQVVYPVSVPQAEVYTQWGTRLTPAAYPTVPEYAERVLYDGNDNEEYGRRRRGPRRRHSTREYSRSRSSSPNLDPSPVRRRREESRYSALSNEDYGRLRGSHRRPRTYYYHRRPHVYGVEDEDTDDGREYDGLSEGKVFSFTPMRANRESPTEEIAPAVMADIMVMRNEDGEFSHTRIARFKERSQDSEGSSTYGTQKLLHVVESQYTGNAYFDGDHSAKLTLAHDPKRSRKPLFRWLHLQQRQLNLDELSAEITRIPDLSTEERHGFTRLLGQVRNQVKQYRTANGQSVKHMMPGTKTTTIQGDSRSGSGGKERRRSLTWLCIPYLSLEQYSGLMSVCSAASFPTETLLQYDYAASSEKRDMEQVVVRANAAQSGECIHVHQLWCIVLDNSLLITCGQMTSSNLCGDLVKTVIEPPPEATSQTRALYVSYCHSVLWALPLDECLTWFSFAKHFKDFWPQAVRFYYRDKIIMERDWCRIINMASHTKVTIELRVSPHPQPPTTGVLQPLRMKREQTTKKPGIDPRELQEPTRNSATILPDSVNDVFHVFTWLDTARSQASTSSGVDIAKIVQQLTQAHEYLAGSTSGNERRSYEKCRVSTHAKVHAYLESKGQGLDVESDEEGTRRDSLAACIDMYNASEIVFRFFLPWRLDEGLPTVGRFWGAIEALCESSLEPSGDRIQTRKENQRKRQTRTGARNVGALGTALRAIARAVQSFQGILSHTPATDRVVIGVPDSLVCAWLHLVMALVQSSQDSVEWQENMEVADVLIMKGMGEVMENLSARDLIKDAVIQPIELVSLMSWKLFHDSIASGLTIGDTYSQYMKELENDFTNNPDRSHQSRIGQLKKEIDIIQRVTRDQQKVVAGTIPPRFNIDASSQSRQEARIVDKKSDELDYEKYYSSRARMSRSKPMTYWKETPYGDTDLISSNRDPDEFSKLSPTDRGGFAEFFGRECTSLLDRRDDEFHDYLEEAGRLEAYNMTNIDITKDKQEKAVYAFTMVTIIFLPLGTISSIFGMNTSDIANLELSQWVYWATALPTTLIVIIGGLWWMGELQSLVRWVLRLPKNGKESESRSSAGYRISMAAQPVSHLTTLSQPEVQYTSPRPYYAATPPPRRR
ncbi:hypothetical protein SUNI508_12708 [Seiridium unicorne]|uniref:Mg2+ transporter n=1 Tax=Seiridium unicorne TaxID=138068 RepID=A0ABR2VGR6_9PEZI